MKVFRIAFLYAAVLSLCASLPLAAEMTPTRIKVRAVSRDAKVIGSGVGGARITIVDRNSGEILARGVQVGGTGDTERIMKQPRTRGGTVYDTPDAAYFETTLMIDRPTEVEVIAEAPLAYPQALQRTSKTVLLIPVQDVGGEGILLEINGFIVQILEPNERVFEEGDDIELLVKLNLA